MPETKGFSPHWKIPVSFYLGSNFSWLNLTLFHVSHYNERCRNETWMTNADLDERIIVPLHYFPHHKVVLFTLCFFHFTMPMCLLSLHSRCSQPVNSLPSTPEIQFKFYFFLFFQAMYSTNRGTVGGFFLAGRSMVWWPVSSVCVQNSECASAPLALSVLTQQDLCDTAEVVMALLGGCRSNSFSTCGVTGHTAQSHGRFCVFSSELSWLCGQLVCI